MSRTVTVVGIDIGVKNLAICKLKTTIVSSKDDTDFKYVNKPMVQIEYWDVINLFEDTDHQDRTCKTVAVEQIVEHLTRKFWTLAPILCCGKIDHVAIERQMNTTEMAYYAYILQSLFYSCMFHIKDKGYNVRHISFQNPKKKFDLAKLLPDVDYDKIKNHDTDELNKLADNLNDRDKIKTKMDTLASYNGIMFMGIAGQTIDKFKKMRRTTSQNSYVFNKKLSIVISKALLIHYSLIEDENYLERVKNKKDDLCDAFNIAYYELVDKGYLKNHTNILKPKKKTRKRKNRS